MFVLLFRRRRAAWRVATADFQTNNNSSSSSSNSSSSSSSSSSRSSSSSSSSRSSRSSSSSSTANFQSKNLLIWSLGQTNSYKKEVGFPSAPTSFLAQ